jgi:hypothetical protein
MGSSLKGSRQIRSNDLRSIDFDFSRFCKERGPCPAVGIAHRFSLQGLLSLAAGAALFGSTFLFSSCGPATTQTISVTNNGSSLTISGSGFSNIPQCAQVALVGLPPPQAAVGVGLMNCSGGAFSNFNWSYGYTTASGSTQNCQTTGTQAAVVTATDQGNSQVATQNVSIAFGPNCALLCGTIGQPACPAGCLTGVNSNPGAPNGTCVACGGEGQPPCAGNVCQNGLHLNGIGNVVCTAACGHTNQSPCLTDGSALGVTNLYHCYNGSTIPANGSCTCVFDPNSNPCQEVNSGGSGVCLPSVFIPTGCR